MILLLNTLNNPPNLARLDIDKDAHDKEHEQRVEDPHVDLVAKEVAAMSLGKFDDTEDGPHEDKGAGDVERVEVALPGEVYGLHACGWHFEHSGVEDPGDYDEEAEDDDLNYKADNDDVSEGRELIVLFIYFST